MLPWSLKLEFWSFDRLCPKLISSRRSAVENLAHPLGNILESFGAVAARLLGDAPAVVADFVQCLHDRRPIVVAFRERHAEAFPKPFVVAFLAAEFFDVQLLDAFAQDANPFLGPAVVNDVA